MGALDNAIQALASMATQVQSQGVVKSSLLAMYGNEVNQALDAVAQEAVDIVPELLSKEFDGKGSTPGQSPQKRTGTLQQSIHWRDGKGSRSFPQPSAVTRTAFARFKSKTPNQYRWYKAIRNEAYSETSMSRPYPKPQKSRSFRRVIEVSPQAVDSSDRARLEYYSFYLQSGWWSKPSETHHDKGYNALADHHKPDSIFRSEKKPGSGSAWNPPRPYLSRLADPLWEQRLQRKYRKVLTDLKVPQPLVEKATLDVEWVLGRRVPFFRDNK
jgi:hypothetical protein